MTTLKEALSKKLSKKEMKSAKTAYDILGSIAIIEIPDELIKKEKMIGETLLGMHPNIRTVLKRAGIHKGTYRTRKLKVLAGERTKTTEYRENNARLKLDVEKVYFSPRLSTERKRIYGQVKEGEKVLVMFSGCAPYPVVIGKNTKAKEIYGIELNPIAHKFGLENIKLNKLNNVFLINGDVKKEAPKFKIKFDRIIMPLPKDAGDFLESAFFASKKGTTVNFYTFSHIDEIEEAKRKLKEQCEKLGRKIKILGVVKCGNYSPRVYRVCIDFKILS